MAENSEISWTDHTFNPWLGCTRVSDGCKNCYAETLMDKRFGKVQWGPQGTRQRTSGANWKKPLAWDREAKKEGRRYRVFCASLADVFEDRAELEGWRADLLRLIEQTPNLDWLLLTKRPENVNRMIERATGLSDSEMWLYANPHVAVGTSVENQQAADERIPHLLEVPATVRFLSMEPLLGPVTLNLPFYSGSLWPGDGIGWVIVGGESGPSARPMHPRWVRSIRNECVAAGVPFHFKQWGEWIVSSHCENHMPLGEMAWPWAGRRDDGDIDGDTTMMFRCGKKAAGRVLDGETWNQFP